MNEAILLPHIRGVRYEDRKKLPRFSYSRLEQFLNCPMAYDFKYNKKMYSSDTSLALELGSLLHRVLEEKAKMLGNIIESVDYKKLDRILHDGIIETDEKTKEPLRGLDSLKAAYWESWYEPDSEGRTYDQKLTLFDQVVHSEMENDGWQVLACEEPFEFVWDNKVIFNGFIDRVDVKDGDYRVVDYKTSKKPFPDSKLPTSLQFGIYALAILLKFGRLPIEYKYRFILIDQEQLALTKGWEKRLVKKLDQTFEGIEKREKQDRFEPKASPLCYYCGFCSNNPNAAEYKNMCEYYSLWTPTNKTFEKHQEWNALETNDKQNKRKLIF